MECSIEDIKVKLSKEPLPKQMLRCQSHLLSIRTPSANIEKYPSFRA